jgi:hypothetical protein
MALELNIKNDWLSSGKYALEQLRTVIRIIDGDIFIDPANLRIPKIRPLEPWLILIAGYAPSDELKKAVLFHLQQSKATKKNYEDVETLIKSHLNQVFIELQFLANSRLAHQPDEVLQNTTHTVNFLGNSQGTIVNINSTFDNVSQEIKESLPSYQEAQYNLKIALKYYSKTDLGTSFLVRLTNCSSRPIIVTEVFLNLKSGKRVSYQKLHYKYIQLSTPLPITLDETKFGDYLFPLYHMNEILGEELITPLDVTSVEVVDSLEQYYKFPSATDESQRDFLQLQREIQEHWEENDQLSNGTT